MNIFVLDENPIEAARLVPISVASRMALEAAQMLAVGCSQYGLAMPHKKDGNEYSRKNHQHHPCTKWVCKSKANMKWVILYALMLCYRHNQHYGKFPAHRNALHEVLPQINERWVDHTPFHLEMPDEFKTDNVVESYRAYIRTKPYYVGE